MNWDVASKGGRNHVFDTIMVERTPKENQSQVARSGNVIARKFHRAERQHRSVAGASSLPRRRPQGPADLFATVALTGVCVGAQRFYVGPSLGCSEYLGK
jgi:hypothetical protein